jgi:bifunctional non-homologous end joining protein LigD
MRAKTIDIRAGGHVVKLTHPDKVLFAKSGITKAELVEYYAEVAKVMVPHVKGRPLIMERYPDGIARQGFFNREVPEYFPRWIDRVALRKIGGKVTEVVADDAATLIYLAEQNCITIHSGLSRRDRIDHPDRMIIDLDPSTADFAAVQSAARTFKQMLDDLELTSFAQITGSRGMHIVVPLDRSADFDRVHDFARELATLMAKRHPRELTVEQRKERRGRRIFLDYLRNSRAQTAVAPYSVRAREGAPVATPLTWPEALAKGLNAQKYSIKTVLRRIAKKGDAWSRIDRSATSLSKAQKYLEAMR